MRIIPLYKLLADDPEGEEFTTRFFRMYYRDQSKAMLLVLEGDEEFPVGTPDYVFDGKVRVYRKPEEHFHGVGYLGQYREGVPAGQSEPGRVAIAFSRRLGQGRRLLRRLAAEYPIVNKQKQRYELRMLVREGD